MKNEHHAFLQLICDEVDKLTAKHCPIDISPGNIQVNIKILTGKNPLGDHIRLLGNAVMVRLDTIKYDIPPLTAGRPRDIHQRDKFLGFEPLWVNLEHMSSAYPGKDIEIEGKIVNTCHVSIMEDNAFRIQGTCEEFFDSIHVPLMEYLESQQHSHEYEYEEDSYEPVSGEPKRIGGTYEEISGEKEEVDEEK